MMKMTMNESMSSKEIRDLIRLTAANALAFIASDVDLIDAFRAYQVNGESISHTETKNILEASARYFRTGVRL